MKKDIEYYHEDDARTIQFYLLKIASMLSDLRQDDQGFS
jgi:hypothetical protein